LKIPSIGLLVEQDYYSTFYNEEGRLYHRGEWQDRLTYWMNRKVLSSNNNSVSFFETKDDDVFKATPLKKDFDIYGSYSEKENKVVIPEPKKKEPEIIEDENITYENNVSPSITSKPFFYSKYKIVANSKGFYLNKIGSTTFARFKSLQKGESPCGDINIKKPMESGWSEVSNFYLGSKFILGYIKQQGFKILFKEKIAQETFKEINL
jgi:hypothetical protein